MEILKPGENLFEAYEVRTRAAIQWLKISMEASGGKGSSAYYSRVKHPFRGWQLPYPETTGYIIETLFQYAGQDGDTSLNDYAFRCADWLTGLQLTSGAFPGGYRDFSRPSIFNTAQISIGLQKAYEKSGNAAYYDAFKKATAWLVSELDADGSWPAAGYVPGHIPSYYTRVIWPVLQANTVLQSDEIEAKMRLALEYHGRKVTPGFAVKDWGAFPGKKAFTHFIAYTIRGFLESGLLLKEDRWVSIAENILLKIATLYQKEGRLAGSYDEDWRGDYSFTCVTGNCQVALNLCRMYAVTGNEDFYHAATAIFSDILPAQRFSARPALHGALPGSMPIWGQYLPFRYPNHAVKFFLDAYYWLRILKK